MRRKQITKTKQKTHLEKQKKFAINNNKQKFCTFSSALPPTAQIISSFSINFYPGSANKKTGVRESEKEKERERDRGSLLKSAFWCLNACDTAVPPDGNPRQNSKVSLAVSCNG